MWKVEGGLVIQGLRSDYRVWKSLWEGLEAIIPLEGVSGTRFEIRSNRSDTKGYSFAKGE